MRKIKTYIINNLRFAKRGSGKMHLVLFCLFLLPVNVLAANQLELFVSIAPQKFLADRIGKDRVNTQVLIAEGQSPHLFHPSTRQLAAISKAVLLFTVDMEFERILVDKLSQTSASLKVVNSAQGIEKIIFPGHHGHAGLDPHVWLSPPELIQMASTIAAALGNVDPENTKFYNDNLSKLTAEFEAVDRKIKIELSTFSGASFYVFHPSFAYFARRYGLHQEAVEIDGKAPTPKQLSRLITKARKENVKVIFVQAQFDPRSAKAVAQAIGGEVLSLNPLAENVMENLQKMASTIRSGLSR
jgi:zinc transport system substrate-binding protein